MKLGIKSDTGKSARDLAKQAAKQIAREPLEILKQAGRQVGGEVLPAPTPQEGLQEQGANAVKPELREKIKSQDRRLIQALEKEIEDIKAQKKMAGEAQESQPQEEPQKPLVEPSTKPSRKLFSFGRKAQAERQKTRVEKPIPTSG